MVEKLGGLAKKKDDKYMLDHSIIVYLMGPQNQFMTYLGSNCTDEDMANMILDQITHDIKNQVNLKK